MKRPTKRLARRPLEGLRVLDLTQVVAGPYCTTLLANLGAEVVKLEPPKGDELRTIGRYRGREAHQDYFNANNYSKKSIALDLKDPAGRKIGQALARKADVLVENFSPGTARRLGLGWTTLRKINPRLLYCSISGFGQTGPDRRRSAMDPIIQAASGVMSVTGEPGATRPLMIGAPLADVIAGMYGAYAIVGALHSVKKDGRGRLIDVSMQSAMIAAIGPRMGQTLQAGTSPTPLGNQNPMRVPSDVYRTSDGQPIFIMVPNDRSWAPFCRAVGKPEWIQDRRFADAPTRVKNRGVLNDLVMARIKSVTAAKLLPRLEAEGLPHARVNDYAGALAEPQVAHRKLVRRVTHPTSGPIRLVGPPWIISDIDTPVFAPPLLDQHAAEVLRDWLSWTPKKIKAITTRRPHDE